MLNQSSKLRMILNKNTTHFRKNIKKIGFTIKEGDHPIVPIMIGNAKIAKKISEEMLKRNIFVVGFSYPVVPKNEARIRVQIGANHNIKQLLL